MADVFYLARFIIEAWKETNDLHVQDEGVGIADITHTHSRMKSHSTMFSRF